MMIEQKIGRMALSHVFHVYLLFFSSQCVHVDVLLHVEELEAEVIPIGEHKQKGVSAEGRKIHLN